MLLQVGELARRTALTVRTLHHYDEIGLLKPSGRSDAGYRLYSQADVQRLHGIQTLRQMGLPLSDIAGLLAGGGMAPEQLIGQQIRALDQQIAQATELRGRLSLLRDGLVAGAEPDMGNWLQALALMATYGKYFSAAELKHIFSNWNRIEADLLVVKEQVRRAMDQGQPVDAPEVQSLAYRWMALMLHWMGGDIDLLERWGHMFRTEPSTQGRNHAPPGDMIRYIESAIQLRMDLLLKYMDRDDLRQLGHVHHTQWQQLEQEVQQLVDQRVPPAHPRARAAATHWDALFGTLCCNDAGLRAKLMRASASEPLLRAGSPLSEPVRNYLHAVPRLPAAAPSPS
ncbi:MerR family transcriptional regulator [Acidovorax sp. NCPPB 3576]|uniref:MerR family transcriptional regulator n=1 Tax=Acidovorax sp. NCPPB 3576 TaxID=2940488 RepID=UPI00234BD0B2|nr:MerR family transcriptional regulator [Acidovorax sp. NCPPB 3576]WCM90261.1 MerR family transcriptional regulator [Acidovorax sp. NCPPB 3576]